VVSLKDGDELLASGGVILKVEGDFVSLAKRASDRRVAGYRESNVVAATSRTNLGHDGGRHHRG